MRGTLKSFLKPRLYINVGVKKIQSFQFFLGVGCLFGLLMGILLAKSADLNLILVVFLCGYAALIFFSLTLLIKRLTGRESLVYYHNEIIILVLCALALFLLRKPILLYLDVLALQLGIVLAIGRLGCYSAGCCHGCPYRHGVVYGKAHALEGFTWYYRDIRLFPIQLIESLLVFAIVLIGIVFFFNKTSPGTVMIFYWIAYGLCRFVLEFFRGDIRPEKWGLSEAQWTSLILVSTSLLLSTFGILPLNLGFYGVLVLLIPLSIYIILNDRGNELRRLRSHRHRKELANGLAAILDLTHKHLKPPSINVFTTSEGLMMSYAKYEEGQNGCFVYTLSFKQQLPENLLGKLASFLQILGRHKFDCSITKGQNNIYHFVFKEISSESATPLKKEEDNHWHLNELDIGRNRSRSVRSYFLRGI